eukprot:34417_6
MLRRRTSVAARRTGSSKGSGPRRDGQATGCSRRATSSRQSTRRRTRAGPGIIPPQRHSWAVTSRWPTTAGSSLTLAISSTSPWVCRLWTASMCICKPRIRRIRSASRAFSRWTTTNATPIPSASRRTSCLPTRQQPGRWLMCKRSSMAGLLRRRPLSTSSSRASRRSRAFGSADPTSRARRPRGSRTSRSYKAPSTRAATLWVLRRSMDPWCTTTRRRLPRPHRRAAPRALALAT